MWERLWVQRVVLVATTLLVFATSLPVPFLHWDDGLYVTDSARTQTAGLEGLQRIWSSSDAWDHDGVEFFPLRDTAYWALWQVFGKSPVPFHLFNVLVHAAVVLLVLTLGRRLVPGPRAGVVAFWGALLFAVHPVHVESVTWVAGLKDPLFTFFLLLSVLAYLSYRKDGGALAWAACLLAMVAGLLCKSIAMMTPLLLLAVDRFVEPRASWRQALTRLWGPALISALFAVQFVLIGRINQVLNPPHGGSWGQHVFLMLWALVRYVQQAFAPATFRIHYCFPPWAGGFDLRIVGLVVGFGVLGLMLVLARRSRFVGFLMAWFFACLVPVANLIPFPAVMADRYLYASSIAACLGLAWGVSLLAERLQRPLLLGVTMVFALVTSARGVFWTTPGNLWAEVVEDGSCLDDTLQQSSVMFFKAAESLEEREPATALELYGMGFAHRGYPRITTWDRATSLSRAGRLAHRLGREDLAVEWTKQAVTLERARPDVWLNRATSVSDSALALEAAQRAFRLDPTVEAAWVLGLMQLLHGDEGGVVLVGEAVRLDSRWYCPRLTTTFANRPALRSPRVEALLRSCQH